MAPLNIPARFFNSAYLFLMKEPMRSTPLQILYGGASSGKSVFIAQRDILDMINEERNFLVTRNTANTLRDSVFAERVKAIKSFYLAPLFDIKESTLEITYKPRGTKMFFRGLDDPEKIKSITVPTGTLTDLRCEEATEQSEDSYNQLRIRLRGLAAVSKRTVLSFNPIFRSHWICKRFFTGRAIKYHRDDSKLIFHSTFRDNQFLDEQDKKDLLGCTGYYRDVYTEGRWGVLGDLIFTDWESADLSGIEFDMYRYGIDFGFTVDPSVVLKLSIQPAKRTIYIVDEIYGRGWTNDVLAAKAKPMCGGNTVWCDSAEPKSIAELHQQGENSISAYPVQKGRDSVYHSIQWLQQWKIVVDRNRCYNTINELSQYQWQKTKNGETINQPIGVNDHCIAALRYATERDRLGSQVSISV